MDEHIRELSGLIRSGAVTPQQKKALVAGIIALRKQCGDVALERKFADLIPDNNDAANVTSGAGSEEPAATDSVYKYFDKAGILLYVGITARGMARNRQHNESKEWWRFVHRQEIEHFPSRAVAHEREVQLIERFRPPFNKQHNKDHAAARRFYLDMTEGRVLLPHAPGKKLLDKSKLLVQGNNYRRVRRDGARAEPPGHRTAAAEHYR